MKALLFLITILVLLSSCVKKSVSEDAIGTQARAILEGRFVESIPVAERNRSPIILNMELAKKILMFRFL